MKKSNKKGIGMGGIVAIGAGVAAIGAGAYSLLGHNGKKNQKKVQKWVGEMESKIPKSLKKEVVDEVKKIKKIVK